MTRGSPVINKERDLAGATPETLARVLLRNQLRPRSGILSSNMHKPLSYPVIVLSFEEFSPNTLHGKAGKAGEAGEALHALPNCGVTVGTREFVRGRLANDDAAIVA